MKDFNELCKMAEELDAEQYPLLIAEKTASIFPSLCFLTADGIGSMEIMATFFIASVYADGKLDECEYALMLPALKLFFGEEFDFETAKALVKTLKPEGKELKKLADRMVDILGMVSEELKNDIILVSLLICAADGKVTFKEKQYIKQLIRN